MADEKPDASSSPEGKKSTTGLVDKAQESAKALADRALQEAKAYKEPEKTQVYRSIFRVKHDEQPRNRALSVLTNVFFHLHPAKINRDAVRYSYTWGMGGITFYIFLVLTVTGVLLMFYYHPTLPRARCPLRQVAPQHAPLGRSPDDHHRLAPHVPRLPHRFLQDTARVQLEHRRVALGAHPVAVVHGLPVAG
jgi:hypothetical protein